MTIDWKPTSTTEQGFKDYVYGLLNTVELPSDPNQRSILNQLAFVLITVALVTGSGGALSADLDACMRGNTLEINDCLQELSSRTDANLNAAYTARLNAISKPKDQFIDYPAVRRLLKEAQRAWIKFREKDCMAVYKLNEAGSSRNIEHLTCLISRTEQRIKELQYLK